MIAPITRSAWKWGGQQVAEVALTYSEYLKIEELLALQRPLSEEPDELFFIVIHQTYELWFKELLHELDRLRAFFEEGDTPRCLHTLKRVLAIERILLAQLHTLETMTPQEFLAFRDFLGMASAFQSFQFREIEFALGRRRRADLQRFPEGSPGRVRLEARYTHPSVWDSFLRFLAGRGYAVPVEALERDVTRSVEPCEPLRTVLERVYAEDPLVTHVCELLVDLDERFMQWRYHHVKLVERMIGRKKGTGGSAGVQYLETTLKPFFPDLWALRTELANP
ncbi:MAG: tryptophan 2,3-dioxygenase [Deltaproteobacteria bacterium]|nr:tryptophan 2,3-dioxygenase [Deltaproteobacteria bacterium]